MVDYKNHIGLDDIIIKAGPGKWNRKLRFLEGQNRNHRLYFYFYKNGFNLLTVMCLASK